MFRSLISSTLMSSNFGKITPALSYPKELILNTDIQTDNPDKGQDIFSESSDLRSFYRYCATFKVKIWKMSFHRLFLTANHSINTGKAHIQKKICHVLAMDVLRK